MTTTTEADERSLHWEHHINHWQSSGLSGADYCRQHDLTYHCFIYWRHKLANAITETEQPTQTDAGASTLSAFVAVQPSSSFVGLAEVSGDDLHLCLPNGLEIRNIYGSNLGSVRALLAQL